MFILTNEKIEKALCKDQLISGPDPHYTQLANQGRLMFDMMSIKNVPEGIRTVDVHLWRMTETRSAKNWENPIRHTAGYFILLCRPLGVSTKHLYRYFPTFSLNICEYMKFLDRLVFYENQ